MVMATAGYKEGNDIVKQILDMRVVSKYRMARDLGVSGTQVYNWLRGVCSPSEKNYQKLLDYRLYVSRKQSVSEFKPRQ